ncbi:MAG: hypothetical protein ATN35_01440 [Epulopiscium sp. Nele67-Bin004]|nr:MAG: hypothetical protein ATN35_01440 [Epulopiscium sp. Nele67-Bin004]
MKRKPDGHRGSGRSPEPHWNPELQPLWNILRTTGKKMQSHNSQQFWNGINKLGPRKFRGIPVEIILESGECSSVVETVFDNREKDFANVFSVCSGSFDDAFLKEMIGLKEIMESDS